MGGVIVTLAEGFKEGVLGTGEGCTGEVVPEGGPQEGVLGEMGAKPGELSVDWLAVVWESSVTPAALLFPETERVRFNPSSSINIDFPFYLIADANSIGISYVAGVGKVI